MNIQILKKCFKNHISNTYLNKTKHNNVGLINIYKHFVFFFAKLEILFDNKKTTKNYPMLKSIKPIRKKIIKNLKKSFINF